MGNRLSPREILGHLVAFPTVSRETNLPLIDWVAEYLEDHGVSAHRQPKPDEPKAGLFAHVGPEVEGAVVLSGHTDVVPIDGQEWQSDPFQLCERDGRLYGRGTCDMKGFDALAIWAMVEARARGVARPVQIALSYDEEIGCTGARPLVAAMDDILPRGALVIVGEPSMMRPVTGHKGGVGYDTFVTGFEVHSSIAYQGVSAIHEAARLVEWATRQNAEAAATEPVDAVSGLFDPPYSSWHVGRIEGGTAHNITAKDCYFQMGMRAVPGDEIDDLEALWRAEVARVEVEMQQVRPEAAIRVEPGFRVPPLKPEREGAAEALVRQITGENGTHVVSYATEGGHFQEAGYSAVVCGPGDIAQAHQPDEFIAVAQLEAGQRFMERLLDRLQ